MDVNRQAWASSTSLLVHPADLYIGIKSERTFVQKGTPLDIQVVVTDLDGNAVAGRPFRVKAARLECVGPFQELIPVMWPPYSRPRSPRRGLGSLGPWLVLLGLFLSPTVNGQTVEERPARTVGVVFDGPPPEGGARLLPRRWRRDLRIPGS